ncbi:GNAT family N-acetyltransferase [Flavobacterium caseinilyticum]|uniref:GNAT family N-acetyltransferase n=1 Tax=Flavobacterium caseinilyticum TaxID=2541732 RepID=A0A4R5B207_9FLAO|nr:GNAT family N-acetyltransferase [Flavobacterium caseinilyticum]TDD78689.1 GNAT family N-acetyltransferase [Flavobacterium caseinilyticum]
MQNIKQIAALDTFIVRHPVLRSEKPIESCHFEGDTLETTVHFGLFEAKNLLGVISLFEAKNDLFTSKKQFQIRGMAVLKQHQKKGFGEKLIMNSEKYCRDQNANLIWFNAREAAIGFYQKMGYQVKGLPFEIKNVGKHIVMFKEISNE